ncbi:proteasome activator [Paeniglutamicibacter sp. Y32M11]|uniref:proteasome activator n=1 Tax=Paeniglutamicibacter sp. Y32M11 TaxID=2853258 RepID=UPI001C530916|nr:proteasome activator [Paeniglutamicibacter sp. Y32M11]QXQ10758.1 bacterial proteasome activator family protein [Paeniglutamicibacter sp. Y32M11]
MSEHSAQIPDPTAATNTPASGDTPWPFPVAAESGTPSGGSATGSAQQAAEAAPEAEAPHASGKGNAGVTGIGEPAKLMRIGGMIKQLLDEVRAAPLDAEARTRMADIHERSVHELETGLTPELADELHRIRLPFADGQTPSEAELRVAQAQLVGWLEGVFHGLQAAMAAQQLANQQLAQRMAMRQLPPGTQVAPGIVINEQGEPERITQGGPGSPVPPERQAASPATEGDGGFGQYL